jgi:hypothetical protein
MHNVHLSWGLFSSWTKQICNFFIYNSEHIVRDNFVHVNKLKSLLGWIIAWWTVISDQSSPLVVLNYPMWLSPDHPRVINVPLLFTYWIGTFTADLYIIFSRRQLLSQYNMVLWADVRKFLCLHEECFYRSIIDKGSWLLIVNKLEYSFTVDMSSCIFHIMGKIELLLLKSGAVWS